jgi:glycosyltransferase involved in cell wall biosynthesis
MEESAIRLVYLGKRGGGLNLLNETLIGLTEMGIRPHVFVSSKLNHNSLAVGANELKIYNIYSPNSWKDFLRFYQVLPTILHSVRFYITRKKFRTYFPMPSPFDLVFYHLNKSSFSSLGLHDLKSHDGDSWPKLRSIELRVSLANEVICFSNNVASQVNTRNKSVKVCELPSQIFFSGGIRPAITEKIEHLKRTGKPLFVLIGRVKKYKNLENFYKLADSLNGFANFLVAGEGDRDEHPYVYQIHGWLSDAELNYVISEIDVAYLGYVNATQSGIAPILIAKNKKIVLSQCAGLVEQCEGYTNALILPNQNSPTEEINIVKEFIRNPLLVEKTKSTIVRNRYWQVILNDTKTRDLSR